MKDLQDEFTDIYDTLRTLKETMNGLNKKLKLLEKRTQRQQKLYLKTQSKQKKVIKKPSGFATPTTISESLCKFLDKPCGTQVARTEVTKYIGQYIKDNNTLMLLNAVIPSQKILTIYI